MNPIRRPDAAARGTGMTSQRARDGLIERLAGIAPGEDEVPLAAE